MSVHSQKGTYILDGLSLLSTEPDGAPQNVIATAISSTEIEVYWEEVPAINENGIITIYEVEYLPLHISERQITSDSINTAFFNTTLTGLQEYVEYNISVRAYTSVGPGPYSDPVTERTFESCKLLETRRGFVCHLQ